MPEYSKERPVYLRRRIGVFGGLGILVLALLYSISVITAPLPSVAATVTAEASLVQPTAAIDWPSWGSAAVGELGHKGMLAQNGSTKSVPIASMAKVITALVILDEKPIPANADGPTIAFTDADVTIFHDVIGNGGSWAPVVSGEKLTERQALQAMLLPSANNYAISLAKWTSGSVSSFVRFANTWLASNGLTHTHLFDPTGLDPRTVSASQDLIEIAKRAITDPVLSTIVSMPTVTLPGVGTQKNGNKILGVDGINGVKTGFTDEAGHCLLFAAKANIDGKEVAIVGVVLGAPTYDALWSAVPKLLRSVKNGFHNVELTGPHTSFGSYATAWGAKTKVLSPARSSLLVWSDTPIKVSTRTSSIHTTNAGDVLGSVTFTVNTKSITQDLTAERTVSGPDFWWRASHPQVLFSQAG